MKIHGEGSGVASELNTIIQDKKWKSAWLVLQPYMYSWYFIHRVYWKSTKSSKPPSAITSHADNVKEISPDLKEEFWIRNELFNLKVEDKNILLSKKIY